MFCNAVRLARTTPVARANPLEAAPRHLRQQHHDSRLHRHRLRVVTSSAPTPFLPSPRSSGSSSGSKGGALLSSSSSPSSSRRMSGSAATSASRGDAPAAAEDPVEAEAALFEAFTAVPSMAGAVLAREPGGGDHGSPNLTLHVTTTQRDLAANRVRRSAATLAVPTAPPTAERPAPPLHHPAFGAEERGVLLSSISPSGARRMVVRSGKDAGGDRDGVVVEVWGGGALVTEVLVPAKTHGSLCGDGTFGGVSWSAREGRIAYVAEASPADATPEWGMGVTVTASPAAAAAEKKKKEKKTERTEGAAVATTKDAAAAAAPAGSKKTSWRGQGEWREEWGEQLVGRKEPAVFILEVADGTVTRLAGLPEGSVAASGPVWAPPPASESRADAADPGGGESTAVVCPVWAGDIDNFKSTSRRLGLVFCFNRPSAMYLVQAPVPGRDEAETQPEADTEAEEPEAEEPEAKIEAEEPEVEAKAEAEAEAVLLLTPGTKSAMWPRFSPDGNTLVFVSHDCAVASGAHMATAALHAVPWSRAVTLGVPAAAAAAAAASRVVVPAVDAPAAEGAFPGLYMFSPPPEEPWVVRSRPSSAGSGASGGGGGGGGMLLQTTWGAGEAIVHVDIETGAVSRITPPAAAGEGAWVGDDGTFLGKTASGDSAGGAGGGGGGGSWGLLDVREGVVAAVHSDPGSPPRVHVAWIRAEAEAGAGAGTGAGAGAVSLSPGGWIPVQSSYSGAAAAPAMKAIADLEYHVTTVLRDGDENDDSGGGGGGGVALVQSITVRPRSGGETMRRRGGGPLPAIILPHGGPHASCAAGYVASVAYLASLGYAVVYCNYRGSTGYGERALQSLVGGAAGAQDVADCVKIAEAAVAEGVADPARICVVGGSHGGFLGAHLIGQAPDMFRCAVLRNPVTDIAAMVPLTDIPDWCFVETLGREAYSDLPSASALQAMREASPVHHLSKVKAPVLMLLGAVDLRVPPSNGLRYAAALREAGGRCAVRVFPHDSHGLTNPRTEFESFVTVAAFLRENMSGDAA